MMASDDLHALTRRRAVAYGEALRRLRLQIHVSQDEAARAAGLSQAAWTKYERGRSLAFLNLVNQERCVNALGRTLADLEAARATLRGGDGRTAPFTVVGSASDGPFVLPVDDDVRREAGGFGVYESDSPALFDLRRLLGDGTRVLKIAGEDMSPYADSGGFVVYSVNQPPRRNLGVVLKRRDGRLLLRRYVHTTPAHIVCLRMEAASLDGRAAYVEREEQHPAADIEGVYPVLLRGESGP